MGKEQKYLLVILILIVGVTSAFFVGGKIKSGKSQESTSEKEEVADSIPEKEPVRREYGIETDSFQVVKGTVKPGQFLADILLEHKVSYPEIDRLVKKADSVFDVRKIAAGKDFTIFCSKDSTGKAKCFVYEPNAVDYVIFDMRDSIRIKKGKKPIRIKERTASGVIQNSLYMSLKKNHLSPVLALELSEIYAWSIDFYGIDKGDRFRVIYNERYVDGEFVGIGDIKTAEFVHRDSSYFAFRFEQDSSAAYFDEKGNSLKKAFLKAPLQFSRISSRFSNRRLHPVLKVYRAHHGVDYAAPRGTPVHTVGDGKVVASGYSGGNGNYVKIRHNSIYTTMYLHLYKRGVRTGEHVSQGDLIGRVGSTGLSTGPHLDYRVYKHGSAVNPLTLELPPGDPVKEKYREDYMERKSSLMERLKQIPFDKGKNKLAGNSTTVQKDQS